MSIEVLLVQFLVLAFTGALWWLARRDLASRAAPPPPVDTQELEQLCATLEALVTDLSRRLAAMEQRLHKDIGAPPAAPVDYPSLSSIGVGGIGNNGVRPPLPFSVSPPEPQAEPENASHAALYALLDEGVTDPAEIARRTGLGRGEVDLILSLRARRAL